MCSSSLTRMRFIFFSFSVLLMCICVLTHRCLHVCISVINVFSLLVCYYIGAGTLVVTA